VMTVNPGFGHQHFLPATLPKIGRAREMIDRIKPACGLEVDGGVDATTAPLAVAAGGGGVGGGAGGFFGGGGGAGAPPRRRGAGRCAGGEGWTGARGGEWGEEGATQGGGAPRWG